MVFAYSNYNKQNIGGLHTKEKGIYRETKKGSLYEKTI